MSVSSINIQNLTDLAKQLEANKNKTAQEQAAMVQNLFSGAFLNTGAAGKAQLEGEISRLENYIKTLEPEVQKAYNELKSTQKKVENAQAELVEQLTLVASQSQLITTQQNKTMNDAVEEAHQLYSEGTITKEEIPSKIAQLIQGSNANAASKIDALTSSSDEKASAVKQMVNTLTSLWDKADQLGTQLKSANASLDLTKLLSSKMNSKSGAYSNNDNDNRIPVYTPLKEAYADQLVNQYQVAPTGDIYSMDNAQLQQFNKALGMTGTEKSFLYTMKEQGFTYKEAMYATQFVFGQIGIKYTPGGALEVPYGHGSQASSTYQEFEKQVKELWGKGSATVPPTDGGNTGDGGNGGDGGTTVPPTDGGNTGDGGNGGTTPPVTPPVKPPIDIDKTDPIGFSEGNTTYDFAVDRNGDNIFNNKTEFLGAQRGIEELKELDSDNDGKLSAEELKNLYVVKTDHNTGATGFINAEAAGITSIDLKHMKEMDRENVNGNTIKNLFSITVNGRTATGHQTLDTEDYLNTAYKNGFGANFNAKLSDAETKDILAQLNKDSNPVSKEDIQAIKDALKENLGEQKSAKTEAKAAQSTIRSEEAESVEKKLDVPEPEKTEEEKEEEIKKEKEEEQPQE